MEIIKSPPRINKPTDTKQPDDHQYRRPIYRNEISATCSVSKSGSPVLRSGTQLTGIADPQTKIKFRLEISGVDRVAALKHSRMAICRRGNNGILSCRDMKKHSTAMRRS